MESTKFDEIIKNETSRSDADAAFFSTDKTKFSMLQLINDSPTISTLNFIKDPINNNKILAFNDLKFLINNDKTTYKDAPFNNRYTNQQIAPYCYVLPADNTNAYCINKYTGKLVNKIAL